MRRNTYDAASGVVTVAPERAAAIAEVQSHYEGLFGDAPAQNALALLPAGIVQAWASVSEGLWYARSPEIVHSRIMETLVWLRVPGDIVFAIGGVALAAYAVKLLGRRAPAAAKPEALELR